MKISIGDMICALGYCFVVGEIIYQDYNYFDGNWDVEFLDDNGGYHHWKSEFDGGYIVKEA